MHIDGLAASAASVVAMAGDTIKMPENATLMIHNAWTYAGGGAEELRKTADELDRINDQIAGIYAARTGKEKDEISALMTAETWMSGTEALNMGFVNELIENKRSRLARIPKSGLRCTSTRRRNRRKTGSLTTGEQSSPQQI